MVFWYSSSNVTIFTRWSKSDLRPLAMESYLQAMSVTMGRDQCAVSSSRRGRHSQVAVGVKPHPERLVRADARARSRVDFHVHVDGLAGDRRLQTGPDDVVHHHARRECGDRRGHGLGMADSEPLDAGVADVVAEVGRLHVELLVLHANSSVRVHGLQAVHKLRVHLRGGEKVGGVAYNGERLDSGGDDVVVRGLRAP